MTHYDDETLGAYVDGELERETAAALEADLKDDPILQRRVADLRAVNAALREWSAGLVPRGKPCGRPARSSPTGTAVADTLHSGSNLYGPMHWPQAWPWCSASASVSS